MGLEALRSTALAAVEECQGKDKATEKTLRTFQLTVDNAGNSSKALNNHNFKPQVVF
jgi:hypothetical protein